MLFIPKIVNMRRNVTMKSSTTGSPTISNVVLFVLMVDCALCKAWARRLKPDGAIVGLVGALLDITERKQVKIT